GGGNGEIVHIGQHDVQEDQIPTRLPTQPQPFFTILSHGSLVALAAQVLLEAEAEVRLVLDDEYAGHGYLPAGNTKRKVLPAPSCDSSSTVPPCAFTMCETMASPRPVPLIPSSRAFSPRTNRWKISFRSRSGIPRPWSWTEMATLPAW